MDARIMKIGARRRSCILRKRHYDERGCEPKKRRPNTGFHMEISVDTAASARDAIAGGATRLEVCTEGGLTPNSGFIKFIRNENEDVMIFAMIRQRSGSYVYSREEMDMMICDLERLKYSDVVDGFVFAALKEDGTVNEEYCREVRSAARPLPVTFSCAFDKVPDPMEALEAVIKVGYARILTSGRCDTAMEGLELIKRLIEKAGKRIIVMPTGGITTTNLEVIMRVSGAREFHLSAAKSELVESDIVRTQIEKKDSAGRLIVTEDSIKQMVELLEKTL